MELEVNLVNDNDKTLMPIELLDQVINRQNKRKNSRIMKEGNVDFLNCS